MERTSTIHEVYDSKTQEFIEQARCPFCHRTAKIERKPDTYGFTSPDPHFVRAEHGCGGNVAFFRKAA